MIIGIDIPLIGPGIPGNHIGPFCDNLVMNKKNTVRAYDYIDPQQKEKENYSQLFCSAKLFIRYSQRILDKPPVLWSVNGEFIFLNHQKELLSNVFG